MKKKVIFIGSPAYSGSTMLDMMLANDLHGMSLGEIIRLMLPHRKHHLQEIRQLSQTNEVWKKIIEEGADQLYKNLFDTYSDVDFFVDSSKDVFWIRKQSNIIRNLGYEVCNVLLYKEPADIAQSFAKRNRASEWEKSWKNYYRLYFTLIDEPIIISYKNLTSDPQQSLCLLCEKLNIPFFEDKHHFWNKEHNTFFGNDRTRFHLKNVHLSGKSEVAVTQENKYQTIYYLPCQDPHIIEKVNKRGAKNPNLNKIWNVLKSREIFLPSQQKNPINGITMNRVEIWVRKLKRVWMYFTFRYTYFFQALVGIKKFYENYLESTG